MDRARGHAVDKIPFVAYNPSRRSDTTAESAQNGNDSENLCISGYGKSSMIDCYKILGVRHGTTAAEIKSAYRRKAKELHPDMTQRQESEAFRLLVQAYEILNDLRRRAIFDESYSGAFRARRNDRPSFDYRLWLCGRPDHESRAKLIFFDLMHGREDDAVSEFKRMSTEHADFSLKHWFSREDFMDFGYILAEELTLRGEFYDAFNLLEQIIRMEYSYAYFRIFFPEVLAFTLTILRRSIEGSVNDELALDVWERALDLGFSDADDAFFLTKMAEIYTKFGDVRTASVCTEEAARLSRHKKQRKKNDTTQK